MTKKGEPTNVIVKSEHGGGRSIRIEFRLSDWAGHTELLDALTGYQKQNVSPKEACVDALSLMVENDYANAERVRPIAPRTDAMLLEMRNMLQQVKTINAMVIEALQNQTFNPNLVARITKHSEDIDKAIEQFSVIEGAGNNGGEIIMAEDDDEDDWR